MTDHDFKTYQEILDSFDFAMLTTVGEDDQLRARPMLIAAITNSTSLQFVTRIDSGKVDEITENTEVGVTCQDGRRFLSMTGRAMIINDRDQIDAIYEDSWAAWFPEGKDDPAIRLVQVSSVRGEYWKTGSLQTSTFALGLSQALHIGSTDKPEIEKGKVDLA